MSTTLAFEKTIFYPGHEIWHQRMHQMIFGKSLKITPATFFWIKFDRPQNGRHLMDLCFIPNPENPKNIITSFLWSSRESQPFSIELGMGKSFRHLTSGYQKRMGLGKRSIPKTNMTYPPVNKVLVMEKIKHLNAIVYSPGNLQIFEHKCTWMSRWKLGSMVSKWVTTPIYPIYI